ncbi:SAM-dependent methyltransferase [Thermococcus chitonophagus]|uniref:SAM-dependent methyltransferase n=1 Tax=Thermococcus chitonophagus TaxID=54262 RepID=A0A160VTV3_9EURY|nr:class I SAM-dependent methyltransferase [Thermococcus chitonophagus]ASJ17341.1 SAM-dependent methyltransferase [Thermococcus chitonophagus]CUX77976.1 hypothetical protein CHITON_1197 [Thermococcus chitonophagus]
MSLEELYKYLRWRMDPKDEGARKRFQRIVEVAKKLALPENERILDICAGTGIAGVAFALATNASKLTVLDARGDDLEKVNEWIKISGRDVPVDKVVGDARSVHELVGEHDIAVLWGLTMPHFDAFDAVKLFASVALTLSKEGYFIIEETDRVYGIMYMVGYKDFLVESEGEGYQLASVHSGYDKGRGAFKRTYYKLPGFEKVTEEYHRLWDLASQLAIGSIFFREYKLFERFQHGVQGVSDVIVFRKPRKNVAEEMVHSPSSTF